jgi:hypothetical protein
MTFTWGPLRQTSLSLLDRGSLSKPLKILTGPFEIILKGSSRQRQETRIRGDSPCLYFQPLAA